MSLAPEIEIVANQVIAAKIVITQTHGIGETLRYTLHAWHDGACVAVAEFPRLFGQLNTLSMLVGSTGIAMKKIFDADALTFSGEGYMATEANGVDLAIRFASNDLDVRECLQVLHVIPDELPLVMSIPFKYGLGRTIEVNEWQIQQIAPAGISKFLCLALSVDADPMFDLSEILAAGVEITAP
jgi:hypothetical protein